MDAVSVRIENMEPMRVASVRALSEHPEAEAWARLRAWAEPRGLLNDPQNHPVLGFNSPPPSADRKEYGYEFWIKVGPEVASGDPVEIKEIGSGTFAVMKHRGYPSPNAWKQLWEWAQNNGYRWRKAHELERIHDPMAPEAEVVFDLYLPIES